MASNERSNQPKALSVVSGLQGQLRYVRASRRDASADLSALHERYVVDPYWGECAAGGELESLAALRGRAPIANIHALEAAIEQLDSFDLHRLLYEAFGRAATALPGPHTTIWLLAGDPDDGFTTGLAGGVNGTTAGAGKIWLHVLPLAGWLERIPAAVAHEHHHSVWLAKHYEGEQSQNLLNYLLMEGEACMFVKTLFPRTPQPWVEALTPDQEKEVWGRMKQALGATSHEVMAAYMFGGVKGLPPFCGYTVGYHIIQAYLTRNLGAEIEDWTGMDTKALLAEGGYDGQVRA